MVLPRRAPVGFCEAMDDGLFVVIADDYLDILVRQRILMAAASDIPFWLFEIALSGIQPFFHMIVSRVNFRSSQENGLPFPFGRRPFCLCLDISVAPANRPYRTLLGCPLL